jgi:hypothetical protein
MVVEPGALSVYVSYIFKISFYHYLQVNARTCNDLSKFWELIVLNSISYYICYIHLIIPESAHTKNKI